MTRGISIRRALTITGLTVAWCGLWGDASLANAASGLVVATVITVAVGTPDRGRIRPGPLMRFSALVAVDLLTSTVSVAREILTPADGTDEAIIAVRVPIVTRSQLLLLVVAVTVTPGTAVVDADTDTGILYLHVLHAERRDAITGHVHQLAELACEALPIERHDRPRSPA